MILNNSQIYSLFEILFQIKQTENKLPIKVGFNIIRNIQILEPIYNAIADSRKEILLTYGVLNTEGHVTIPQDKVEEVNQLLLDLSNIENDISLMKLNLSDLEYLSLTLDDIEKLYPIINGEA